MTRTSSRPLARSTPTRSSARQRPAAPSEVSTYSIRTTSSSRSTLGPIPTPSGCRFRVKDTAMVADTGMAASTGTAAATGMAETTDMEETPMATVIKAMVMAAATGIVGIMVTAAMAMAATRAMVASTGETRAMVAATEATRAMVVATEVTRATAETKATVATKATEEIKDMVNSLTAATKDTVSSRTITRATAREGMQRTSTAGKPPDTPHDSSKNWLV